MRPGQSPHQARTPVLQRQHQPSPSFEYGCRQSVNQFTPSSILPGSGVDNRSRVRCRIRWRGWREDAVLFNAAASDTGTARGTPYVRQEHHVQRTIREQIGKFQSRGSADAATLPMLGDDAENPLLRGRGAHRRLTSSSLRGRRRLAVPRRSRCARPVMRSQKTRPRGSPRGEHARRT